MNRAEYFDLLDRRNSYKKNIGALDFLIHIFEKRLFMSSPEEAYSVPFSKSQKYKRLEEINQGVGKNPRDNELSYLLGYAQLLNKVQMTQTFIGIVRYLITKIHHLNKKEKKDLLQSIRTAYIISGDDSILELLAYIDESAIKSLTLPKKIKETLTERCEKLVSEGTEIHDEIFSFQDNLIKIDQILKEKKQKLLAEQICGLEINRALIKKNEASYLNSINKLFAGTNLSLINELNFKSNNLLSTIKTKKTEQLTPDQGLVSIIMSCFNSEETVCYALNSIIKQTYKNIEILICDDRSEDNSLKKIMDIAKKDKRIKVFRSHENQGTYNIRNSLIKKANGKFITFQDSDDWSHPQRIEEQVNFIAKNNISVCSTRWLRITPNGNVIFFLDGRILRFCVVSTMVKRSVFSIVPRFRQSLVAADTEFHEACIKFLGEEKVKTLEKPLILGLWGDGSLTKKKGLQAENNGRVATRRRNYSDIAARQRILGSEVVPDSEVIQVLKDNNIYRECKGVELVEIT